MSNDRHDEAELGLTTVVQLPEPQMEREKFLRKVQAALGDEGSLITLPIIRPASFVYLIPQLLEDLLRDKLNLKGLSAWEEQLRAWGALAVSSMLADALVAAMARLNGVEADNIVDGTEASATAPTAAAEPQKLSIPPVPVPGKIESAFPLPPAKFVRPDIKGNWHLGPDGANVLAAWKLFDNDRTLPWKNILVGHIDTGYTKHRATGWDAARSSHVFPELGHDHWNDGNWNQLRRVQAARVWDDPYDNERGTFGGHGTRISAMVAGYDATNAFAGVAPGACIVPFRVTDSVIVDHVKVLLAQAIHSAVERGCKVINISLGALVGSRDLASALDRAYESGVIVCCAAGQVWRSVIYPARYNRCLTLAGVGPGSKPWASSARGKRVDLCAPADGIRRIQVVKAPSTQTGQHVAPGANGDGTSYAAAMCSGAAVLWLAYRAKEITRTYTEAWQVPEAFKTLAETTARKPQKLPSGFGSGVLDVAALLSAPLPLASALKPSPLAAA